MSQVAWRDRLLPDSIVARMSVVLFAGILLAQALGAGLWAQQINQSERQRLAEISTNLGSRIGQTAQFFTRLPNQYRHIVLDQLRDMGGTRFFVSVNAQLIELEALEENENSQLARARLSDNLQAQTGPLDQLDIQFVAFENVKILSGENRMVDLPLRWQRFALVDPQDQSPVVVIQYPVSKHEWLYVAAIVPVGESFYGVSWFTTERLISLVLISITVLALTVALVRWIVRPLRLLARQADSLGRGQNPTRLNEQGTREMMTTIRAFNSMGQRIHKFIADRERVFASISHDLKTPLTRARLRVEMLERDEDREALIKDLGNVDIMLKGALQMLKEGAIHENPETVDLTRLLREAAENAEVAGLQADLDLQGDLRLTGRPLALQRIFSNLIDNSLHYAQGVEIRGVRTLDSIQVWVMDRGPGIQDKEKVFLPYYRQDRAPNPIHVGLGLGIVKDLVEQQGGKILLLDRPGGGLTVQVELPLDHFESPAGAFEQGETA